MNLRGDQHQQHSGQLGLYPRVGKRSPDIEVMRRRDFLNYLADNWQKTGSFLNDVQDMTESKRAVDKPVKVRSQTALLFPGPRVGRSDPDVQSESVDEIVKKWAVARMGKRWAAARVGKKSTSDEQQEEAVNEPEKRVPFARFG